MVNLNFESIETKEEAEDILDCIYEEISHVIPEEYVGVITKHYHELNLVE